MCNQKTVFSIFIFLLFFINNSTAEITGKTYKLRQNLNFTLVSDATEKSVKAGTKYKVIDVENGIVYVEVKSIPDGSSGVEIDTLYSIEESKLKIKHSSKFFYGMHISVLYLPFKYRFKYGNIESPSQITPSINMNAALCYSILDFTVLGFSGLTSVTISDINSTNDENYMGVSYGGGLAYNIDEENQIFLVGGADRIGGTKGKEWEFEGKWWASFGIGFKIFDF